MASEGFRQIHGVDFTVLLIVGLPTSIRHLSVDTASIDRLAVATRMTTDVHEECDLPLCVNLRISTWASEVDVTSMLCPRCVHVLAHAIS